jgi:hypothetical protein
VGADRLVLVDVRLDRYSAIGQCSPDGPVEIVDITRAERVGGEFGHPTDIGGDGRRS